MKLKSLFLTPKKAILTSVCIVVILAIAGTATVFAVEEIAKNTSIGTAAAEEKALSDAGVSKENATFSNTEFEFEKGKFVYEIEFKADGIEYDYVIKASDGTVLSRRVKVDDDYQQQVDTMAGNINHEYIGIDAAISKALADAGLEASDVTFTEQKLDSDDGVAVYDIQFYTSDKEHDYEIDALTGDIYKRSSETRATTQPDQSGTADIGIDAAKTKALADAGVKESEATITEEKKNHNNSIVVYDIEFYTADGEYEYEINAVTGDIHDKSFKSGQVQGNVEGSYIGIEKAKDIALSHAGFSISEVSMTKTKFENDDGVMVYEVEFVKERTEYEYTIDAVSGKVLEFDSEYDD